MSKQQAIPKSIHNRMGTFHIHKGKFQKMQDGEPGYSSIVAWDAIEECELENCKLFEKCPYLDQVNRISKEKGKICRLKMKYLKAVLKAAMEKVGNNPTQEQVVKIGFELIPLYNQLFKFGMYEYGISNPVFGNGNGNKKANPIYKEARETIKAINRCWKEIVEQNMYDKDIDKHQNLFDLL